MNKHEAIKKIEQMGEYERFVNESIPKLSVLNILNQLDEPEKVKIPQFVADLLEFAKLNDWDLEDVFEDVRNESRGAEISKWFYQKNNMDILALAWILGYEVEEEKRYLVKMKKINGYGRYLNKELSSEEYFFASNNEIISYRTKFTRKELEEDGFGWVFDCPGIEVREVEE